MVINKKNAVLIDIDGTICDSQYPLSFLNGTRDTNNYDLYFRTLDIVKPIEVIISDIASQLHTDDNVVFLTGRNAELLSIQHTMTFLKEHFMNNPLLPRVYYDFYFRPIGNHIKALEYKTEKYQMLQTLYNFTHIYEDEIDNVQMFYKYKQNSNCIVHWVHNSEILYNLNEQENSDTLPDDIIVHEVKDLY